MATTAEVCGKKVFPMPELLERARAFLDALEADRQAALTISLEKAEEAKLIEARLEGFQAALQILCGQPLTAPTQSASATDETGPHSAGRRRRRRIPDLIVRELSFSGQPMTARQIAKAIEYTIERTETALSRMEKDGQVHRDEGDRWSIGIAAPAQVNGHAARTGNGRYRAPLDGERAQGPV
jgi:hypothetical protein